MPLEPLQSLPRDFLKSARFFKEVCGTRNNGELLRTAEEPIGMLIHLDHGFIFPTDEEQRRCRHLRQVPFGKVRPSAPRDDGSNGKWSLYRRLKSGCRSCAGTEVAQRQLFRTRILFEPGTGQEDAIG